MKTLQRVHFKVLVIQVFVTTCDQGYKDQNQGDTREEPQV